MPLSSHWSVEVEGRGVPVYHTPVAAFACFDFGGSVEVLATTQDRVDSIDVRPERLGIQSTCEGHTVRFSLVEPCMLSVEVNGDISRPLYIFANPLTGDHPPDGEGSVRTFAPGRVHDVGEIVLHSGETLHIPGGAIVRGWISGENVSGARICGHGILDGSDPVAVRAPLISLRGCRDVQVSGIVTLNDQGWSVVPGGCEDIVFRDFKLIGWNDNSDGIDIVGSRRVRVKRCFLRNKDDCVVLKATRQAVGLDISDVEVSQTVLWNAEWGNALEIGFELRNQSVSNVVFRDCDVIHVERGAVFSIHNGDTADVHNILYENIRVEDARDKLIDLRVGMSIYSADCPHRFSRMNPERERGPWGQWIPPERGGEEGAERRGRIRDISFRDIQVAGDVFPDSPVLGYSEQAPVENVTVDNLCIHGTRITDPETGRFTLQHAQGVRFV